MAAPADEFRGRRTRRRLIPRTRLQQAIRDIKAGSRKDILLDSADVSDGDLKLLSETLRGSSVTLLSFRENGFADEGVEHLAKSLPETSLKSLLLGYTGIGDQGVKALSDVLQDSPLEVLDLSMTEILDEGLEYLAAHLKGSRLRELDLSYDGICDAAVLHLAEALATSSLTSLVFQDNAFGAEGVKGIADALSTSSLTKLSFQGESFYDEDLAPLLDGLRDSGITEIKLGENCSDEFRKKVDEIVTSYKERSFVLQLQAQASPTGFALSFRTASGNVVAALDWTNEQPVEELPEAVLSRMIDNCFQLPFKHFKAFHIKIVMPQGGVLDVGPTAASLAQQLGL